MENILTFIQDNLWQLASNIGLVSLVGVYLVNRLLNDQNVNKNADDLDRMVDNIQKQNEKIGEALRYRLIAQFKRGIQALEEDDGIN